ncbi:type VI secretion system tube protein TssD [Tamlana sp. 2_MG-2023]|uniref:type VI secretion system tube protein TssD n=1 Tax=unclassified Tamlana TaxID=2614803 RepID=UPI0026E45AD8|nr:MULTISPECIES: type VI secretion system tube protein TssD [unclassified Tamlana]MDO6759145.1 type VI secretion system tube protein TssD [Tamlana sp. 2_MG-2023]MDO6789844.1 type VI secretion system tube protein TssD [Tamlana sp. 1_MG-2023]
MIKAKLLIDGKEINVLGFTFGFNQKADYNGRPNQKPVFIGLNLTIETRKDLNLAEWSFAPNETKQIELHILPVILGTKTRKIKIFDCHLVNWKNDFSSNGNQPMTETLEITAAGFEDSNSSGIYSASWRTTFPRESPESITREEIKEPQIIDFYYTDEDNNRNTILTYGDEVYLVVESKHMIGEVVDLKLNKKTIDFMYEGNHLKDNIIEDYLIRTDNDKILVTVIEEDNEELE